MCTSELELSDEMDDQKEFNEIMDNVFVADMHGFTLA